MIFNHISIMPSSDVLYQYLTRLLSLAYCKFLGQLFQKLDPAETQTCALNTFTDGKYQDFKK